MKTNLSYEQINLLKKANEFHEQTRGYFYKFPQRAASARRDMEIDMNLLTVNANFEFREILKFKQKLHTVKIEQSYSESCKNVYIISRIYFDNKKSNFLKIKNLLKNL